MVKILTVVLSDGCFFEMFLLFVILTLKCLPVLIGW